MRIMLRYSLPALAAMCMLSLAGALAATDEGPGLTITGPAIGGPTIQRPTTAAATQSAIQAATQPAAASQPSADTALTNLLKTPTAAPVAPPATLPSPPEVMPAASGVAPGQPAVNRLREGQPLWNRVGRLVKDKTGEGYMFAFESDGKALADPPMGLLPCRMLEQMETVSEKGTKPVKFRVSGQVTEYHGQNYLLVSFEQAVKDLGRGLD